VNILVIKFAVSIEGETGYQWRNFCSFGGAIDSRRHFPVVCRGQFEKLALLFSTPSVSFYMAYYDLRKSEVINLY
jgi:hypothetical protein